jgi:hypothetical protein
MNAQEGREQRQVRAQTCDPLDTIKDFTLWFRKSIFFTLPTSLPFANLL